jgi:hypothetical protein
MNIGLKLLVGFVLLLPELGANTRLLADDRVNLKIHNSTNDRIDFYISSAKRTDRNRWAALRIQPNGDGTVTLASPDPFIVQVQSRRYGVAKSQPEEIKAFLKAHPDSVFSLHVEKVFRGSDPSLNSTEGQSNRSDASISASLGPEKESNGSGKQNARMFINLVSQ